MSMTLNRSAHLFRIAATSLFCLLANLVEAQDCTRFYASGAEPGTGNVTALINSAGEGSFYYIGAQNTLDSCPCTNYLGLPQWREGLLLNPQHAYAGFSQAGPDSLIVPVFYPDALGVVPHQKYVPLASDQTGDDVLALANLDILEAKIAFSETRLFYALKCNTMTYPVSSGLTFYSYMGIITNPAADSGSNPIVFGLMNTVNAPGIITPGLYKITGTSTSDLILIGSLDVTVDDLTGVLTLSCLLSDLHNDPDFSSWFDPSNPLVATQAMTSRITLTSGNQVSDTTAGCDVLLQPLLINFANSFAPVVSNPVFTWENGTLTAQVTYSDADQNPAQLSQVSIDSGSAVQMSPVDLAGFEQPVSFISTPLTCAQNWQVATFSFINGGILYTFDFANPDVAAQDELAAPEIFRIYPNPVKHLLSLENVDPGPVRVYNLKGQLMLESMLEGNKGRLDVSGFPPGMYILQQDLRKKRFIKL
jgi:hypothetical protein